MANETGRPLDAAWVARKHATYDELTSVEGALWWIQSDPDLGGIRRLVRMTPGLAPQVQTPADIPVGGWLHAYGGGSYAVGTDGHWIVSATDSKVYRVDEGAKPELLVPGDDDYLYGDLQFSDGVLLAVRGREDGDEIVEIALDGTFVRVLVSSPGFLGAPRLCHGVLAYLEWDVDHMPWDASRLTVAAFDDKKELRPGKVIAGGENESVVQPTWGPNGLLYFLSDRTGWWNLYRWDSSAVPLAPMEADCAPAPWEGGYQSFTFMPSGEIALSVNDGFRTRLVTVGRSGQQTRQETDLTSLKPYVAACGDQLAVIGSSTQCAPTVRLLKLGQPAREVVGDAVAHAPALLPPSPTVRQASANGRAVQYLLHLPAGGEVSSPVPLLVRAHPGPTDDVPLRLDWTVQYFTSRGFAVAQVAYRGSTGQGRTFRQALHGHWGEYDVEDCELVAARLIADGVALAGAVFITGASAGGYTALQAACRTGTFTAATAISAITDPARWTVTAPRFQRAHARVLAGPAGAVQPAAVSIPVLLIHGTADDVAPVSDARRLAEHLAARGSEHETLFLDGVGHYLSAPAGLQAALEAEFSFYERLMPS